MAQDAPALDSIEAIDARFQEKLQQLERDRLAQIAELAARPSAGEAAAPIYETYFRSALTAGLFQEAEPVAEKVLDGSAPSPTVRYLAEVINIMAEADRGAFDESLQSIVRAVRGRQGRGRAGGAGGPPIAAGLVPPGTARHLLPAARAGRPVRCGPPSLRADPGERPGRRRERRQLLSRQPDRAARHDRSARPLHFQGHDVDGDLIKLGDAKGQAVLAGLLGDLAPAERRAGRLDEGSPSGYRDRGLKIIGVNLDALAEGGRPVAEVLPEVRHYLLEYNIPWPNIVNTPGDGDIAAAYGVTEIPANVLIGKDGRDRWLWTSPDELQPRGRPGPRRLIALTTSANGPKRRTRRVIKPVGAAWDPRQAERSSISVPAKAVPTASASRALARRPGRASRRGTAETGGTNRRPERVEDSRIESKRGPTVVEQRLTGIGDGAHLGEIHRPDLLGHLGDRLRRPGPALRPGRRRSAHRLGQTTCSGR